MITTVEGNRAGRTLMRGGGEKHRTIKGFQVTPERTGTTVAQFGAPKIFEPLLRSRRRGLGFTFGVRFTARNASMRQRSSSREKRAARTV